MKIVALSDTHGQHNRLMLPKGDLIIHAGDISKRGAEFEVVDFLKWFSALDFPYKIFIAGNHDFFFERESAEKIMSMIPENVIYLNDSSTIINGIKIWGSPVQPWFYDWAFNRHRGEPIRKHWKLIPADTDILITHGPVAGILDKTVGGESVGCKDLLERIEEINPLVHICGHIHEAYGTKKLKDTKFINCSILDEHYFITNNPVEFEMSKSNAL